MQIPGNFFSPVGGAYLRIGQTGQTSSASSETATGPSLRDFAKLVLELRDAQKELVLDGRHSPIGGRRSHARLASASALGLSAFPTPTTLRSLEEVNAISTSFTPSAPTFAGLSSSSPFVGGTYSGEQGDDLLTFTATVGGIVGTTPVQFEVRDQEDNLIETLNLGFGPPGTTYTLSNGLEVTFSAGRVQFDDSFQVDVYDSIGSAVRPDNPFDVAGDQGAGLEPGFTVDTGSFEVNGVSIAVNASDTLNAVLNRITASAAGVTASFDAETESVLLTQNTPGPDEDITLENDTSGLLAATKLDGATSSLGSLDESGEPISEVSALSGIQSGNFKVNGKTIAVDIVQDSLEDVIRRINGAVAGVTAAFDVSSGVFSLRSHTALVLSIEDGTSGLFSGLEVTEGTFAGKRSSSKTRFQNESALKERLAEFSKVHASLFEQSFRGFGAATIDSIRKQLDDLVAKAYDDSFGKSGTDSLRSGLGLDFVTGTGPHRTFDVDASKLGRAFRQDPDELAQFLFAESKSDGRDGLFTALDEKLEQVLGTLGTLLGSEAVGLNLDVSG